MTAPDFRRRVNATVLLAGARQGRQIVLGHRVLTIASHPDRLGGVGAVSHTLTWRPMCRCAPPPPPLAQSLERSRGRSCQEPYTTCSVWTWKNTSRSTHSKESYGGRNGRP